MVMELERLIMAGHIKVRQCVCDPAPLSHVWLHRT